ncbi:hypothetical protein FLONG3_6908 [Fusarium longipes]|uniref:Apple domain-containing protein n=1 Tax=Fusarium longipes TaxID=694270 RepID=A0A395SIW4_9HYPO|nr:hypothetical protein FLONG3_6908 [Fusarium longipes]
MSRSLALFAIAGLAVAGPCKPSISSSQVPEASLSYSSTTASITETLPSSIITTTSTQEDTTVSVASDTTILSTETTTAETTIDTSDVIPETTTTADITIDTSAEITFTTLTSSEESAATTSAAAEEPHECFGSIKIQYDHYIGIRGGYMGVLTWSECAQLCEDSPTCYAFSHYSSGNCWNGGVGDIATQSGGDGWTSGIKTSGSKASCPNDATGVTTGEPTTTAFTYTAPTVTEIAPVD